MTTQQRVALKNSFACRSELRGYIQDTRRNSGQLLAGGGSDWYAVTGNHIRYQLLVTWLMYKLTDDLLATKSSSFTELRRVTCGVSRMMSAKRPSPHCTVSPVTRTLTRSPVPLWDWPKLEGKLRCRLPFSNLLSEFLSSITLYSIIISDLSEVRHIEILDD